MVQPPQTVSVSEEAPGLSGVETHEDGIPDRIVSTSFYGLGFALTIQSVKWFISIRFPVA